MIGGNYSGRVKKTFFNFPNWFDISTATKTAKGKQRIILKKSVTNHILFVFIQLSFTFVYLHPNMIETFFNS